MPPDEASVAWTNDDSLIQRLGAILAFARISAIAEDDLENPALQLLVTIENGQEVAKSLLAKESLQKTDDTSWTPWKPDAQTLGVDHEIRALCFLEVWVAKHIQPSLEDADTVAVASQPHAGPVGTTCAEYAVSAMQNFLVLREFARRAKRFSTVSCCEVLPSDCSMTSQSQFLRPWPITNNMVERLLQAWTNQTGFSLPFP
jgi:hypothetical protein